MGPKLEADAPRDAGTATPASTGSEVQARTDTLERLRAAMEALERRLGRERDARKQAEQLLETRSRELFVALQQARETERQLGLALWASGESIWEWRNSTRRVEVRNFGDDSLREVENAPQLLLDDADSIHPLDREIAHAAWREHLRGERSELDIAFRMNLPRGWCWVRVRGRAVERDAKGRVERIVGTLRDITAQRRAEAELREYQNQLEALVENRTRQLDTAREQLLHSEKLSAIGQLAAGVAHEINNPLGFVSSNINTLSAYVADLLRLVEAQRDTTPTGQRAAEQLWQELEIDYVRNDVHQLLTESSEGLKRIRRIVQDLKDFSRMDRTPAFVLTNLHTCIESSLNVARNEIKYKADVVCEFGELPEVACVPSQINQVLLNLLVNAAQAIGPERGCISIRTESRGDHVRLSIGDNGAGMPEAVRRRVFEPFFTTKPLGQGTGLGLSVSFGIIRQHGGTIEVESTEGVGTVFHLILPVQQPGVEHQQTVVNR